MQPFIGSRIRLYRSMAGKTQEQLSVELDVTKQHLGLIERGECNPSLDLLKRVCQVLDVSPANFFLGCTCRDDVCVNEDGISEDISIDPVTSCGTWIVNLDDATISWSESLYRLIGESPKLKPSLKRFVRHISEPYRAGFRNFYDGTISNRSGGAFRCTMERQGGAPRAIQIQADIAPAGQGVGGLAFLSILDITDLQISQRILLHNQHDLENIVQEKTKSLRLAADGLQEELERRTQAERLLREKSNALMESEANFRSFFDTVDDIFLIADEGGMILHANPATVSKTGYSLEELGAMHILDLHETEKREDARGVPRLRPAHHHQGRPGHPRRVAHLVREMERQAVRLRDLQGAAPHLFHAAAAHLRQRPGHDLGQGPAETLHLRQHRHLPRPAFGCGLRGARRQDGHVLRRARADPLCRQPRVAHFRRNLPGH
jgi:PAS domain S-box-containing protein